MQLFKDKKECCGCTACYNICPKGAIDMRSDHMGFQYPVINSEKCISCGLCNKVCDFKESNVSTNKKKFEQEYFAARSKDKSILYKSSSGGLFTVLSDFIMEQKGFVAGALFDELFEVKHELTCDHRHRDQMRGSKYVQSKLDHIFKIIEDKLKKKENVMFVGTPCQVAGLKKYLDTKNINIDTLFLCDFICHGVSSPMVWKKYIKRIEEITGRKLININFRNKKNGWGNAQMSLDTVDGDVDTLCNKHSSYLKVYRTLCVNRLSCFKCKYTSYDRESDITVADFWNIDNICSDYSDDLGVSTVLVNTKKGKEWFEAVKDNLQWNSVTKKDCWQPHLEYPAVFPKNYAKFWKEYHEKDVDYIIEKYGSGTLSSNMIQKLTPIIKKMGLYVLAGKIYKIIFGKK